MLLGISILIEFAIAVLAILAARRGRPYLYGLALTFSIYVIYDLRRLMGATVEGAGFSTLFLLATLGALVAVLGLWREPPRGS